MSSHESNRKISSPFADNDDEFNDIKFNEEDEDMYYISNDNSGSGNGGTNGGTNGGINNGGSTAVAATAVNGYDNNGHTLPKNRTKSILKKPSNIYSPKSPLSRKGSNARTRTPSLKKQDVSELSYETNDDLPISSRNSFDSIGKTPALNTKNSAHARFQIDDISNENIFDDSKTYLKNDIEIGEENDDLNDLDKPIHFDGTTHSGHLGRKETFMKRHRWGTQRNKKGLPIGRSKTFKWHRNQSIRHALHATSTPHNAESDSEDEGDSRKDEFRQVYWNLPLPADLLDDKGDPITQYSRNKVRTTKYTPLTFVPKNLSNQFKNIANVYFLTMIILGAFSIFGVPSPVLSAVPLIVIVCITAIKDAIEDSRRTGLDMELNNTPTHILEGVFNPNCLVDNVSMWRRFKKLNSRLLFKFIAFIKQNLTSSGRLEKKRNEFRKKHGQIADSAPKNSFDSTEETARKSVQLNNLSGSNSLDNNQDDPFNGAGEEIGASQKLKNHDNTKPFITHEDVFTDVQARFKRDMWKNVKVGDIVRVHNNDEIPADMIILATSDSDGACYVETKDLDGETNLKVRQALKSSSGEIKRAKDLTKAKFWIESEGPHSNLYSYQGNMKYYVSGDETKEEIANEPVTINNTLLRGCTLRNTKWALGIVIFTGEDTKIRLNAGITPTKRSRISRDLNYPVLLNFLLLFIICFISGLVNGIYYRHDNVSRTYFEFGTIAGSPAANGIVGFFVAVILYQSLVPISLYISIEIIKTAQAFFIYSDVKMYYEKLDYPCTPKSWSISDDLGQIEYIFSDKTGTLTQNVMEFKKATINGISYGRAYTEAYAGIRKRQGIDIKEEAAREKKAIEEDKIVMYNQLQEINENDQLDINDLTFISKEFVKDLKDAANGDYQKHCNEHFMLSLALCHSVLTEEDPKKPGKLLLKAQSPDEAALVSTARDVGFAFVGRTKKGVILNVQGIEKEYQVLNILEFNSTRKRMSALIKIPPPSPGEEPSVLLICKGADSIIYSRLSKDNDPDLLDKTANHLEEFATEGLRTLCIAQRQLTWKEYLDWNARHEIAAAALVKREERMEEVADSVERELTLLGGTAIEDRLQDGVPDTISLLGKAGIKLWVLTGDKVETAINIGFSCNLLDNDMNLLLIKTGGVEEMDQIFTEEEVATIGSDEKKFVDALITKYLEKYFNKQGTQEEITAAKSDHSPPHGNFGLVIDGDALKLALKDETQRKFLLLCKECKSVMCCRVSPAQKAAVVKMVKNTLQVMTLAIGDGSNDVAMIQAADVGVGIAGEEGRAAVMSSDYAFGQFRYLTRLVLVHGRWSYKRLSQMIPSFFYKNVIFTMALFWYGIYNDFDGTYLFEYTYLMFYNLAFTSLPVIFLGVLDQDVSDIVSLMVPQLYRSGILGTEWTMQKFWWYMTDAFYQSLISFFYPYWLYYKNGIISPTGLTLEHRYIMGALVSTIAIISCNLYILMNQYRWDWVSTLCISLSIIIVFAWTGIWSSSTYSGEFYKVGARLYGAAAFWACLFVGVVICLIPRFIYNVIRETMFPSDVTIIRERVAKGLNPIEDDGYDFIAMGDDGLNNDYNDFRFGGQDLLKRPLSATLGTQQPNESSLTINTQEIPMQVVEGNDGRRSISIKKQHNGVNNNSVI